MAQMTALMRAGMQSRWVPPREVLASVPAQFDPFIGGPAEVASNPMYAPFTTFPPGIAAADQARLEAAGRERIVQKVQPAFAAMKRFVEAEYLPAAGSALGASALPQGAASVWQNQVAGRRDCYPIPDVDQRHTGHRMRSARPLSV